MILSAVAAMARNRVIGVNNDLPWDIPEDMKFFREKTKGKIMILGRKTFDSFGGKPLPNRYHLVVTRQKDWNFEHPQVEVVHDLETAVRRAQALVPEWQDEVIVAGGGEIYKQSLPFLDRIYLTVIEKDYSGDAKFPDFDQNVFKLKENRPVQFDPPFSFRLYAKE